MTSIINIIKQLRLRLMVLIVLALATGLLVIACSNTNVNPKAVAGIPPEAISDYIYRILKSERTIYGKYVVQRLSEQKVIKASEHWEQDKALPLPAQMFSMTAELSSQDGAFSYGSISPWSLNQAHAPKTEFEKKAMDSVLETGLPFKGYQTKDGKKYFSALYPDKAVSASCADCHNQHPVHKERYPDKVFKIGDVMGGIMINLPLSDG